MSDGVRRLDLEITVIPCYVFHHFGMVLNDDVCLVCALM